MKNSPTGYFVYYRYQQQRSPRTNARMGRVDRNWTKSGGRLSPMARGFVSG